MEIAIAEEHLENILELSLMESRPDMRHRAIRIIFELTQTDTRTRTLVESPHLPLLLKSLVENMAVEENLKLAIESMRNLLKEEEDRDEDEVDGSVKMQACQNGLLEQLHKVMAVLNNGKNMPMIKTAVDLVASLSTDEKTCTMLIDHGYLPLVASILRNYLGNYALMKTCLLVFLRVLLSVKQENAELTLILLNSEYQLVETLGYSMRTSNAELKYWAVGVIHELISKHVLIQELVRIKGLPASLTKFISSLEDGTALRLLLRVIKNLITASKSFRKLCLRSGLKKNLFALLNENKYNDVETQYWLVQLVIEIIKSSGTEEIKDEDVSMILESLKRADEASSSSFSLTELLVYLTTIDSKRSLVFKQNTLIIAVFRKFLSSSLVNYQQQAVAILFNSLNLCDETELDFVFKKEFLQRLCDIALDKEEIAGDKLRIMACKTLLALCLKRPESREIATEGLIVPLLHTLDNLVERKNAFLLPLSHAPEDYDVDEAEIAVEACCSCLDCVFIFTQNPDFFNEDDHAFYFGFLHNLISLLQSNVKLTIHCLNLISSVSFWKTKASRNFLLDAHLMEILCDLLKQYESEDVQEELFAGFAVCLHNFYAYVPEAICHLWDSGIAAYALQLSQKFSLNFYSRLVKELLTQTRDLSVLPKYALNRKNKTFLLQLCGNDLECKNDAWTFESVRGTEYATGSGVYAYEVELWSDGIIQIGIASEASSFDAHAGTGVGDDAHSYSIDGNRKKKWHNELCVGNDYGLYFEVSDVVTCLLDLNQGQLSYYVNGQRLGLAFSGIDVSRKWYPALSLSSGQRCRVMFGNAWDPMHFAESAASFGGRINDEIQRSPSTILGIHYLQGSDENMKLFGLADKHGNVKLLCVVEYRALRACVIEGILKVYDEQGLREQVFRFAEDVLRIDYEELKNGDYFAIEPLDSQIQVRVNAAMVSIGMAFNHLVPFTKRLCPSKIFLQ